jgi:hypothetical protein
VLLRMVYWQVEFRIRRNAGSSANTSSDKRLHYVIRIKAVKTAVRLGSVTFELPVYANYDRINLQVIDIAPNCVAPPIHIRVVPGLSPGSCTSYYNWLR